MSDGERDDEISGGCRPGLSAADVAPWCRMAEQGLRAYNSACLFALRNVDSLLKSQEIAWRGAFGWQQAWTGTIHMAMHDSFADVRTRMSCRSLTSRMALERDLVGIRLGRIAGRASMLGRMVVQTAEDASEPLWRRCDAGLGEWARCRH